MEKNGELSDPKAAGARAAVDAASRVCSGSCGTCPFSEAGGFEPGSCAAVKSMAANLGKLDPNGSLAPRVEQDAQGAYDSAALACSGSCAGCSCKKDDPIF
ncbi:MAG: hypothetical protein AAFY60_05420 [Myxococcota bacterium]